MDFNGTSPGNLSNGGTVAGSMLVTDDLVVGNSIELEGKYTMPITAPSGSNEVITSNGTTQLVWTGDLSVGDVSSITSTSVDDEVVVFNGVTGKSVRNSGTLLSGLITNPLDRTLNDSVAAEVSVRKAHGPGGYVQDGDQISRYSSSAFRQSGAAYIYTGWIQWEATEDHLTSSGSRCTIRATNDGDTIPSDKITADTDGIAMLDVVKFGVGATNYEFPIARGALDEVLKSDAAGVLTFQSGNPFDQPLNTTDDVEFKAVTVRNPEAISTITRNTGNLGVLQYDTSGQGGRGWYVGNISNFDYAIRNLNGNETVLSVDEGTNEVTLSNGLTLGNAGGSAWSLPSVGGTSDYFLTADGAGGSSWTKGVDSKTQSTGVFNGGTISINANPIYWDLTAGTGQVVDPATGIVTAVSWAESLATDGPYAGNISYITISSAGAIVRSPTKPTNANTRDSIYLGSIFHPDGTNIIAVDNEQVALVSSTNQIRDLSEALGLINTSGNVMGPQTLLTLIKTTGSIYGFGLNFKNDVKNPSNLTTPAIDTSGADTFIYVYQDGTFTGQLSSVVPGSYDNGGGVGSPGTVTSQDWSTHRVFLFAAGNISLRPAQFVYNTLAEAEAAIDSEGFVLLPTSGILIGFVIIRGGASDLNSAGDAKFVAANNPFASGSGAVAGGDVSGPIVSVDNSVVRFDGTSGKLIQDTSGVIISDAGLLDAPNMATDGSIEFVNGVKLTSGAANILTSVGSTTSLLSKTGLAAYVNDGGVQDFYDGNGSKLITLQAAGKVSLYDGTGSAYTLPINGPSIGQVLVDRSGSGLTQFDDLFDQTLNVADSPTFAKVTAPSLEFTGGPTFTSTATSVILDNTSGDSMVSFKDGRMDFDSTRTGASTPIIFFSVRKTDVVTSVGDLIAQFDFRGASDTANGSRAATCILSRALETFSATKSAGSIEFQTVKIGDPVNVPITRMVVGETAGVHVYDDLVVDGSSTCASLAVQTAGGDTIASLGSTQERFGPSQMSDIIGRCNGTLAVPTAITSGQIIQTRYLEGHTGANYAVGATVVAKATENWTGIANGCSWELKTSDIGTTGVASSKILCDDNGVTVPDLTATNTVVYPMPWGELYYEDNATATVISTASTWTKIVGGTTLNASANLFTMPNDNKLTYTGTLTKEFHVAVSFSFFSATNANVNWAVGLHKNGSHVVGSKIKRYTTTLGANGSSAIHKVIQLAQNDYIELFVENDTNTDNCTFSELNIVAMALPNAVP